MTCADKTPNTPHATLKPMKAAPKVSCKEGRIAIVETVKEARIEGSGEQQVAWYKDRAEGNKQPSQG
jgi:hypothetical protein